MDNDRILPTDNSESTEFTRGMRVIQLSGILAYPEDVDKRDIYLSLRNVQVCAELGETEQIPADVIRTMMNWPPLEKLETEVVENILRGQLAGSILAALHRIHFDGHEEPSLRKAYFLVERDVSSTTDFAGNKIPCSEEYLRKCFAEFRSVGPLQAALWQMGGGGETLNERISLSFGLLYDPLLLDTTLAISEYYRHFAENFNHSRRNKPEPLLPPGIAWAPDPSVPLPDVNFDALFNTPSGQCQWTANWLKEYIFNRRDSKKCKPDS
jgi:hypothetical protein